MKNIFYIFAAAVAVAMPLHAATVCESAEGVIDLRPDPRCVEAGASETLTYGDKWADPETPAAAVKITLDGETFATVSDGEGSVTWTPSRGGLYTFMHTATDSNGVSFGDSYSASFLVADFPFEAGAVSVTGWSGVYDAQPHTISASSTAPGATVRYATSRGGPYSETHPVITGAGTHTVWCEISAPGYIPQTNSATITITQRSLVIGAVAKSKLYGEDDPPLTYTNSALAGTDRITGALTRDAGEAVGTYAIRQGTLAAGDNYALTFIGADFTVVAPSNAVWYVDATNGADTADGFSWATAKKTIQAALDLAEDGNQIIVTNGVYTSTRGIVVNNESRDRIVTIRSVNGPEKTIIDGGGVHRCAKLSASRNGRTASRVATLSGFTLTNGVYYTVGGVAHGVAENCIIAGCTGTRGISSTVNYAGGAVESKLVNCLLVGNSAIAGSGNLPAGAAWRCDLYNCTVVGNTAVTGAASGGLHTSRAFNCIVTGNTLDGAESDLSSSCAATNSCLGTAFSGTGNLRVDPRFADAANGDFRLSAESPCIDAGDSALAVGGFDLDGNTRVVGNAIDMGCYEVQTISLVGDDIVVSLSTNVFVYDATEQRPSVTVTNGAVGLVEGRDFSVSYTNNVNVGTAKAIVTGVGLYRGAVRKDFEIAKRPVTVSVTGHTATYDYDTTEKTVAGYDATTADGLYDIASATVFDGTASASRTDIGTTSMGLQASDFANNDANFLVAYAVADGGVTISPRVIGDDPANWDIRLARDPTYNGQEQSAPITQVAFVKPDGNLDYVAYALTGDKATDAGNYVVRISGTGNYAGTVEKEWAIMPRNVTLTSGSATWTYDGSAHSETAVAVTGDGFVAGEGATYSGFPSVTHVADAAEPVANAFTYALNANTKAGNYVVATANGTVQMLPRPITLTAPTKEKNYDGQALTFAAAEVAVSGDGYAAGESFTLGGFSSITEAGQTTASFTVADGSALKADYAITVVPGTLTVKKSAQEITVTARSGFWTYDGQTHVLHEYDAANLAALVAGDALEVSFDAASAVATPVDGAGRDGVVPNTISGVRVLRNGTADVTANYTLAWYPGTLTVTKRSVTLTSKSATKAYDGQPLTAHEATVGGAGFVGTDGATFTFTGTQTAVGTSANAFQYSLKAGTRAEYYAISKVEGELAVTPLDISGNVQDWVIELGPSLTYNGLPQIQTLSSVKYKGLDVDYSVTGNQQTDAGAYTMTIAGQGNFSGENSVDWSIAPKALTLTAGSGSRVYDGTALTVGNVTATGFVAGEGATYTCDGSQTNAGSSSNGVATIAWAANTKASNYAVTKVAGTLTVTPRAATVASADISKPYDGTPLELTAADITATGLVAGESLVYSGFASRTEAGQTPATFTYAAGPGTSLGNYTVTPSYGTITIAKSAAEIGVTAASGRWTYDGAAHSNRTYTATNLDTLQPGDALEVVFDPASVVTTPQDGPGHNGVVSNAITSVRVLRNGADDVTANYTVTAYPGTLEVVRRAVVVSVAGSTATATYDGTEKTASGYEATTADALYDIAADTAFSGASLAARTDAGTTPMGLAESDFSNNNPCFDVTYQVADGWVRVDKLDIASGAGADAFSIVLGANPKYNGTVQTVPIESVTCRGLSVTYTLAGENATHAGTYVLTVKANGNFTGERSTTWEMLKRNLTMTSGSATKVYDGTALANPNVTVGGDGFIGLEGATFSVTGSQTAAGTSKNTFGYELKVGTRAGDYAVTRIEGDLTVTRATLPPSVFGPGWDGETPLVCEKVFNGMGQPVEIVPDFDEPYTFLWSLTDQSASVSPSFLPSAPTLRNVADGEITAYFKFVTDNFEPVYGSVRFHIAPKTLLDEMVVLTDEAFYYDPESGQKTPDVTVTDTNALGVVISTVDDYEIAYGDSSSAGAIPVTATGMNNYTGTVTKTFPVLKRPVAPPVIGSKSYNGRTQRATVAADERWTVVANPGGVDAGLYTNVVLRLTNPDDYKWRGFGDDQIDWVGVFEIRRGANGWSREPGIAGWTQGETPSTPNMGTPRNGSVSRILYRRRGAAPETGTETVPTRAGQYTARFVVDESVNYVGTYRDVDFEILPGAGGDKDHTETTGVPVPYVWLDPYLAKYGNGDYEAAGNARGLNGCYLWESYLAGLDPENPLSRFMAFISLQPDGSVRITWHPDLSNDAEEPRVYTILGKASLADRDWTPVTNENKAQMRFFKIKVELP